jgi:sulfur transfer complex TusBCD TusB component (DsrH family)
MNKSARILHILRRPPDERTKEAIMSHSREMDVTVLLIQEGVSTKERMTGRVFVLDEDAKKRKLSVDLPVIDYVSMVRFLFEHDRIICW